MTDCILLSNRIVMSTHFTFIFAIDKGNSKHLSNYYYVHNAHLYNQLFKFKFKTVLVSF